MKQNIDDLQSGQIMLVVKNDDGSFSPLGISQSQAAILNRLLGSFSEPEPFVVNREVKLVKDRLTRVSFGMWKDLFAKFNCELKTINEDDITTSENEEKEIFSDIISLLHCFAMRMYSSRRKKKITLVKEDLENEIGL